MTVFVQANSTQCWKQVCATLPLNSRTNSSHAPDLLYSIVWADSTSPSGTDVQHTLYRGRTCIHRTSDTEMLLHALQIDVTWSLAAESRQHTFVHAGAITFEGYGIILPGVSGAGKSSLVTQFLRRGAQYYSDEYAVIDREGRLHPFPCLLRLRDRSPIKRRVGPAEFGAVAGRRTVHVDLVAFPTYAGDAGCTIETISSSYAALRLLEHAPRARSRPAQTITCAAAVTGGALCLRLEYEDSVQAVDDLISCLGCSSLRHHIEHK